MATERQIAANRANAQRSTGPKTAEGKERSRQNALQHGLTAKELAIPNEDASDFDVLHFQMIEQFAPKTALEEELVHRIALCFWRLRRVGRVEASIYAWQYWNAIAETAERDKQSVEETDYLQMLEPAITRIIDEDAHREAEEQIKVAHAHQKEEAALLGKAFLNDAGGAAAIQKLSRYETAIERSLYRAMDELRRVQELRHASVPGSATIVE